MNPNLFRWDCISEFRLVFLSWKGSQNTYFQRFSLEEFKRKSFLLGSNCGNFLSCWKCFSCSGSDGSVGSDALRMQSVLFIEVIKVA